MLPLDEYAKICALIKSCDELVEGKFILANYKIANILKQITNSKEVYNLLATTLNNFDFEREFSRAQLKSVSQPNKFVLPENKEKLLPFVFCVLVSLNNKELDLDNFIKEFFASENNNHAEEFVKFAKAVVLPFKNAIAEHFNVSIDKIKENEENNQGEDMKKNLEEQEEFEEEQEEQEYDEEQEEYEDEDGEEYEEEKNYPELTAERVEGFLEEVKTNAEQILTELPYERKLPEEVREDVEYIVNTIIDNCDSNDLKNTIALITSLDYVVPKSKTLRLYVREMRRILIELYEE